MTSEVTQCPPSLLQKTDSLVNYTNAGIPSSVECYAKRSALSKTSTDPRTMRCCFDTTNKGLILDHVLANGFNTYMWVENGYFTIVGCNQMLCNFEFVNTSHDNFGIFECPECFSHSIKTTPLKETFYCCLVLYYYRIVLLWFCFVLLLAFGVFFFFLAYRKLSKTYYIQFNTMIRSRNMAWAH